MPVSGRTGLISKLTGRSSTASRHNRGPTPGGLGAAVEIERSRTPFRTLLHDATISLTWMGLAITAAIISAGFARFGRAAEYLPIFPAEELTFKEPEAAVSAAVLSHASD